MLIRPVDDGTHVQADVLKTSHHALLYSVQVHHLVIYVDELHAAMEGALRGREVRPWIISCLWKPESSLQESYSRSTYFTLHFT